MAQQSPSTVLYQDLKSLGIANKDAAKLLFDTSRKIGSGKTVGTELDSRPKLSSKYVNVEPGAFDESAFRPFSQSTQDLTVRLLANRKNSLPELEAHYLGEAAEKMAAALAIRGIETAPYTNALARIEGGEYRTLEGKLELAFLLFITCGSLGDPKRAVVLEEEFAEEWLGMSAHTVTAELGKQDPSNVNGQRGQAVPPRLGIMRINADGTFASNSSLKPLLQTKEGAVIGSGACDIADVGPHVSRKHARVYFENGRWYLVGLKSTNGTIVISGADGETRIVEPPKSQRKRGYVPQPCEIEAADTICLADDTRFIVVAVNAD